MEKKIIQLEISVAGAFEDLERAIEYAKENFSELGENRKEIFDRLVRARYDALYAANELKRVREEHK